MAGDSRRSQRIRLAATMAGILEAAAAKPGNVTPVQGFADMDFTDFVLSSLAVGPVMGAADRLSVGELIWQSINATRAVTAANTNLGIVLLFAPLARAYALAGPADLVGLRAMVHRVLMGLTVADARRAYAAIRLVQPGGLGRVAEHDVAMEPSVTLLAAMAAGAGHDTVAAQYSTNYELVFSTCVPALVAGLGQTGDPLQAIVYCFLTLLGTVPDSLIARKLGPDTAQAVTVRAGGILAAGWPITAAGQTALATFDAWLRTETNEYNPGTTADLTAAALFSALVVHGTEVLRCKR